MRKPKQVHGTFGKGVNGSITFNYGLSAGKNCWTGCEHHSDNDGTCYAIAVEKRHDRAQLAAKLARHEAMPAARLTGMAILEVRALIDKGIPIPWARFSTNGSVPMPDAEDCNKLFLSQLRILVQLLVDYGVPIHLPIEQHEKAEFYRSAIGDLITIRESLQVLGAHKTATGAISWTAGKDIVAGGQLRERRIEASRIEAKERFESTGARR